MDGQRPQLVFELLDVEDDQPTVELDVGRSSEQARAQRALDVALEANGQAGGYLTRHVAEHGVQVGQQGCGPGRGWPHRR